MHDLHMLGRHCWGDPTCRQLAHDWKAVADDAVYAMSMAGAWGSGTLPLPGGLHHSQVGGRLQDLGHLISG